MVALPPPSSTAQVVEARRYGRERDINPFIALLEEVRRSAGHVAWLGIKIAEAPTDDALLTDHSGWMKLYLRERENLVKVSETAVRLGLEERVVKVEERKAELMAQALIGTLQDLGMPAEVLQRAPGALMRRLMAIEATSSD